MYHHNSFGVTPGAGGTGGAYGYGSASSAPNTEPKKNIKVNGVYKRNPEWIAWKENQARAQGDLAPATTEPNPETALVIYTSPDEIAEHNAELPLGEAEIKLSEATNCADDILEETVGASDVLYAFLNSIEAPIGAVNKILSLGDYSQHLIIDNSGSMGWSTDDVDPLTNRGFEHRIDAAKQGMT